jgi:hypothetical protein
MFKSGGFSRWYPPLTPGMLGTRSDCDDSHKGPAHAALSVVAPLLARLHLRVIRLKALMRRTEGRSDLVHKLHDHLEGHGVIESVVIRGWSFGFSGRR